MRRLAAALAAAALLASCGGDEEEQARPGAAEKDAYSRRANAICAELSRETRRLAEETFGGLQRRPPRRLRRRYERRAAALRRDKLAELRALEAPPGEEGRVGAFERSFQRAGEALAARPALGPGRPGAPALERFEENARALGLDECAGSG